MQIHYSPRSHSQNCKKGFASVLLVISTGLALMIMLLHVYHDTANSQNAQKMNMLSSDYQQREDAFLRALVNIVPNHAMRGMTDDSWNTRGKIRWTNALNAALQRSNARQALPDNVKTDLSVNPLSRGANSADIESNANLNTLRKSVIFPVNDKKITKHKRALVSSGIKKFNPSLSAHYPPRLVEKALDKYKTRSAYYPIISNERFYDDDATAWTGGRSTDKRFALLQLPKNHFRYKDGTNFIARHNWWTFHVNFSENKKDVTQLNTRRKQYIFSIYEVPAQLAINAGSEVVLGKHKTAGTWNSKFNVDGAVFASQVKTEGSFTSSSISSRKNIELSDNTSIGSDSFGSSDLTGNNREVHESKGRDLLITSAGDSGRIAFIPINGGEFVIDKGDYADLETAKKAAFYDNPNLTIATPDPDSNEPGNNAISPTSWNYYSRGAHQCKMRVVFDDTNIHFSFEDASIIDADFTGHVDYANIITRIDDDLSINVEALLNLLDTLGSDFALSNTNSIYIKGPENSKVILEEAEDLSLATQGFSIVCNTTLVIASDLNTTGDGVPLSVFAPSVLYGKDAFAYEIDITGSLTSTAKTGVSHIADLKSGDKNVTSNNISATLNSIIHPERIPPINMMNWMIVVREMD